MVDSGELFQIRRYLSVVARAVPVQRPRVNRIEGMRIFLEG
jgi:hypothetical protein